MSQVSVTWRNHIAAAGGGGGDVDPFFSDDFETGNLNHEEGGFSWGTPDDCAVTTDNPYAGTHSLRFYYVGTVDGDASPQLNFELASPGYRELWFEYRIYFPDGTEGLGTAAYDHRVPPEGPSNNKFWKIAEVEGGAAVTFLLESYPDTSPVITKARPMWGNPDDGVASNAYGDLGGEPLITESDLGNWVHWQFHLKVSDEGSTNGAWQMWKDGELLISDTAIDNAPSVYAEGVLLVGYLMGWCNAGFDDDTYIWIDDVKFYDSDPWGY